MLSCSSILEDLTCLVAFLRKCIQLNWMNEWSKAPQTMVWWWWVHDYRWRGMRYVYSRWLTGKACKRSRTRRRKLRTQRWVVDGRTPPTTGAPRSGLSSTRHTASISTTSTTSTTTGAVRCLRSQSCRSCWKQPDKVSLRRPFLTLWRPLLPYGDSYKASCFRPG